MEKYRVTENGQIISNRLNRPMKLQVHKNGHYNIQLQLDTWRTIKIIWDDLVCDSPDEAYTKQALKK